MRKPFQLKRSLLVIFGLPLSLCLLLLILGASYRAPEQIPPVVSQMLPVKAFMFNSKRDDGVRQGQAAYRDAPDHAQAVGVDSQQEVGLAVGDPDRFARHQQAGGSSAQPGTGRQDPVLLRIDKRERPVQPVRDPDA